MKVAIIGAGISGLTIGRILSKVYDVTIFEKKSEIGGIARAKDVNGIAYHTVGGHCLNSKNKFIMDYIFDEILPLENWHKVERNAKIFFHKRFISYPIEFHIREIAEFDIDLAYKITTEIFSSTEKDVSNLEEWFIVNFGETLAKEYLIPYNKKIWAMDLKDLDFIWIYGKLPMPSKKDIFESLISKKYDSMPHRFFYYPNTNTQNTFIESLGKGLNIVLNYAVRSIESINGKWVINGEYKFDILISTMPLNLLPLIIAGTPNEIVSEAQKLKYNIVTNALWKSEPIAHTWTYYPSEDTIFHRHIHIGNFFNPKQNYTITESIGFRSYEEVYKEGKKFDYLIDMVDYNVSEHAYVVYDKNYVVSVNKIKKYLETLGIYTLGRFGEWSYYNMDVCMERAIDLSKVILSRF
ncbi:MAG: NAD(P)-binding protein [Candidatus Calescibacterium sp.]|nr:NAD(P)-binding protein [Candidatus Calescibacterium sp.]